ncbi:hypothetical protein [Streptomyces roseus]|nr:hypothetical protein [Streptomyces roseus]
MRADMEDPLVTDAIVAVMMYRAKVCGSEWADRGITELTDQVTVPLLTA